MANLFVDLALPALNGAGAASDTSGMGVPKTIEVVGEFEGATIIVEASEDGGVTFAPVTTFQNVGGKRVIPVVANRMRVSVSGRKTTVPFTANCDVGAPAVDGDFAAIAIPAGNGAGVATDISAFGEAFTVVVGGTFAGAVIQIQVSEDGTTYAPLRSFAGQGGIWSGTVTANFVRAFVSGRKGSVPFSATAAFGAVPFGGGGGGGGGGTSVLTFRPGSGFTGPSVFDDWDDLYAELVSQRTANDDSGIYYVVLDDGVDPVVIPSNGNTYDLTYVHLIGVRWFASTQGLFPSQVDAVIGDGVGADITITDLVAITGLAITTEQDTNPPFQLDQVTVTLVGVTVTGQANPTRVPILLSNGVMRLGDESRLVGTDHETDPGSAVLLDGGTDNQFYLDGAIVSLGEWAIENNTATYTITLAASSDTIEIQTQEGLVPAPVWGTTLLNLSGPFLPCLPEASGALAGVPGYTRQISGASTVTLPLALDYEKGEILAIKNVTTSLAITIARSGADTIDGQTSISMTGDFAWMVLESDGVNSWHIISRGTALSAGSLYSPPEKWAQNEVAASQTDVDLSALVSVNFDTIKMIRSGSIIGLSTRLSEAVSAGTATVTITKNGVAGTLSVVSTSVSNASGGQSTQAPGVDTYVAGDEIGIQITTTGTFAPVTTDLEAWLQCFE